MQWKKNNTKFNTHSDGWNSCFLQELAGLVIVVVYKVQSSSSKVAVKILKVLV
jgi:hypothetical protein